MVSPVEWAVGSDRIERIARGRSSMFRFRNHPDQLEICEQSVERVNKVIYDPKVLLFRDSNSLETTVCPYRHGRSLE